MASFEKLLRQKSRTSKEGVKFEIRLYQLDIAQRAFSKIRSGRNVIIDLPTGAGKTNVALLVALLLKRAHNVKGKKVLYVVPNRILIGQVVRAATWIHDDITRVAITQELATKLHNLVAAITENDLIITTPAIFASILRQRKVVRDLFLAELGLVIVDEFDEFLIHEPTRTNYRVRFDISFESLIPFVANIPMLLMSGTAPSSLETLVNSDTAHSFAAFIQNQLNPTTVTVSAKNYNKYIPVANVRLVANNDPFINACEQALAFKIASTIDVFSCDHAIHLDIQYLMDRLEQIASGTIPTIRLINGNYVPVDYEVKRLARTLLTLRNKYAFLYEDMFDGIVPVSKEVHIFEDCHPTPYTKFVFDLEDHRSTDEYFPKLRGKANLLLSIIVKHTKDKGLVLTRNTRLSDALSEYLSQNHISSLIIDGRIVSEKERFNKVKEFQEGDVKILIITRNTGRRGLDLPMADYAILYSPKEDEYIVWQELSRIRSTLSNIKPSYILYYSGTSEATRLQRLRVDIANSTHQYKLSLWQPRKTSAR